MNQLRHWYNKNRKTIWAILIIIASVIILIQLANFFAKKNNERTINQANNNKQESYNTNTSILTGNKSAISGESVSETQLKNATTVIDQFISYCNNKDLQKAYDMLTNECKEQMYTSLQIFEEAYYNDTFEGQSKTAEIENWVGNTYKVRFIENMLATGKSNDGYAKQDYITVKKVEDAYKLNINSYVGYSSLNQTTEKSNIKMEVTSKNTYMEYEEYTVKVTNNTKGIIMLDNLEDPDNVYLEDENNQKYNFRNYEVTESSIIVAAGQTKEITIIFNNQYSSTRNIKNITFSKIILDYNEYLKFKEARQNSYEDIIEFKANI